MDGARWYPKRPKSQDRQMVVGDLRFTHTGQRLIVVAPRGWGIRGEGYPQPFNWGWSEDPYPGTGYVGVAADCGWVWEPRVYPYDEALTAAEYAAHARAVAAHLEWRAQEHRRDAEADEKTAARLLIAASMVA